MVRRLAQIDQPVEFGGIEAGGVAQEICESASVLVQLWNQTRNERGTAGDSGGSPEF